MSEIHADPYRCPDCGQPHGSGASCVHCGLRLLGPAADELWNLTQHLKPLLQRRAELIHALREPAAAPSHRRVATATPAQWYAAVPAPAPSWPAPAGSEQARPAPSWPAPDPVVAETPWVTPSARPKAEWSQRRVQNTLLILGVLLLAIAALIFTVVSWGTMGVVGRAAILLLVTAAVAAAAPALASRGLSATAEALAALAISLVVIDAQGARQSVSSLARVDGRIYWAAATAVIAALCGLYATRVKLETPQFAAVTASQLPGLLVALRFDDQAAAAIVLLAQTCVVSYVATRWPRPQIVRCLVVAAAVTGVSGAALAAAAAYGTGVTDMATATPGAVALVVAAATAAWISWLLRRLPAARELLTAVCAVAATAAVFAVCRPTLALSSLPAVGALCAVGCVAAGLALGREWGSGPTAVGTAVGAFALLAEADDVLSLLFGPLTWINRSWSTYDLSLPSRQLISADWSWGGEPATLLTLAAATVAAALLAKQLVSREVWFGVFAPSLALTLLATPLALNWSYAVAIAWELCVLLAALAVAVRLVPSRAGIAAVIAGSSGALLVGHAVPWALANERSAHAALVVAAVASAVTAALRPMFRTAATAVFSSALLAWIFAITRSLGASLHVCAFVLAVAAAVLLFATAINAHRPLTSRFDARVIEVISAGAYIFIVSLTFYEPGWAAGSLLAGAIAAAAVATRRDRMFASAVATGLLGGATWAGAIALGRSPEGAGLAVVALACVGAAAGWLLRDRQGELVEQVAAAAYVVGLGATVTTGPLAAIALGAGAVTCSVVATLADRTRLAAVAAALTTACVWTTTLVSGRSVAAAGLAVALTGCATAGLGWLLRDREGDWVEFVAATAFALGLSAVLTSPPLLAITLGAGALTAFAVSARADRTRLAAVATFFTAGCAWTSTLALGGSSSGAGLALALTGCAAVGVGWLLRRRDGELVEVVAVAAYAIGLLLTAPNAPHLALALAAGAITAFAVSARADRLLASTAGAALAAGCAAAAATAFGASYAGAGLAVAVTGCAMAGIGWLLQHRGGELVELIGVAAYGVGLLTTVRDIPLLSVALAAGAVTCFAISIRPERRNAAYAGWVLCTLLLWRRLAASDVTAPEPYLLPPGVLLVAIGYLRRLRNPLMTSWAAYGIGLGLALEPTLFMTLHDPALTRPLLLGAGALAVVLVGARARLQAPLLLGGATLAIDALVQIAPLAGSLPRWVSIATVGAILLLVGATYEQRLRDLRKLQEHIEAFG